jgi:Pyridoxamine 5'-phosphate oxidase like
MKTNLEKFYGLIEQIKVAMMTTRRPDGHLESRAMANQKQADGADLWFVTAEGSGKLRDIAHDPHVNLAYYKTDSYEWVSASGVARGRRIAPRFRSCTSRTGKRGSATTVIRVMAPPMTLASSSSASMSTRPCSSKSTNRSPSSCSNWQRAGSRGNAWKQEKRTH